MAFEDTLRILETPLFEDCISNHFADSDPSQIRCNWSLFTSLVAKWDVFVWELDLTLNEVIIISDLMINVGAILI